LAFERGQALRVRGPSADRTVSVGLGVSKSAAMYEY